MKFLLMAAYSALIWLGVPQVVKWGAYGVGWVIGSEQRYLSGFYAQQWAATEHATLIFILLIMVWLFGLMKIAKPDYATQFFKRNKTAG